MSVKYKLIKQATPGIKGGGAYKYYVRACERQKSTLNDVASKLAERSSLSRADVVGVLTGLADLVPELLLNNQTVELGELGIFSLHLKSESAEQPRVDAYRLIKGVQVHFSPGSELKRAVRFPDYEKSKLNKY
ncbi:HU family DNA-binding protein [Sunxiuqinia sp. A32]|uniref:HU family DNA-binding protein n=1 Tax=Sunxiuqinia sp. A32 TaxID=3461496 RepID=UPI0040455247